LRHGLFLYGCCFPNFGPIRFADAQAIPQRFLEGILAQLKQGGFVESNRGVQGGYKLALDPRTLTVAQVIQFIDGPIDPARCTISEAEADCRLYGQCIFIHLWQRARDVVAQVYQEATFQKLVEQEQDRKQQFIGNYNI
jgi:Rrf2 family protein